MFYASTAQLGIGTPYETVIAVASASTGIPVSLIKAVIAKESSWNPGARSSSSVGLMQINVAAWGVTPEQAVDPEWSIAQGSRILADQLARRDGDVALALAGYNAGTSRTDADLLARIAGNVNGVQSYVADVLAYQSWYASTDPASGAPSGVGAGDDPFPLGRGPAGDRE